MYWLQRWIFQQSCMPRHIGLQANDELHGSAAASRECFLMTRNFVPTPQNILWLVELVDNMHFKAVMIIMMVVIDEAVIHWKFSAEMEINQQRITSQEHGPNRPHQNRIFHRPISTPLHNTTQRSILPQTARHLTGPVNVTGITGDSTTQRPRNLGIQGTDRERSRSPLHSSRRIAHPSTQNIHPTRVQSTRPQHHLGSSLLGSSLLGSPVSARPHHAVPRSSNSLSSTPSRMIGSHGSHLSSVENHSRGHNLIGRPQSHSTTSLYRSTSMTAGGNGSLNLARSGIVRTNVDSTPIVYQGEGMVLRENENTRNTVTTPHNVAGMVASKKENTPVDPASPYPIARLSERGNGITRDTTTTAFDTNIEPARHAQSVRSDSDIFDYSGEKAVKQSARPNKKK